MTIVTSLDFNQNIKYGMSVRIRSVVNFMPNMGKGLSQQENKGFVNRRL